MSSHVLSEVRRVCDRVGVIREGRFVTVETVGDLIDRAGKHVTLRVEGHVDPADFQFDGLHDLVVDETTTFTLTGGYDVLVDALDRYRIEELEIEEAPLEEVFVRFYDDAETSPNLADPEVAA